MHALLPGERSDTIDGGRGIVLALPLTPGWMLDSPVPNDLVQQLLSRVNTLAYVTPSGERVPLPTANFSEAFREAADICRKKVR